MLDCGFLLFATLIPTVCNGKVRKEDQVKVITESGEKRVYCGVTDTTPIVVHGAGNTDLSQVIQDMKFNSKPLATPTKFIFDKIMYHMTNTLTKNVSFFLLCSLGILVLSFVVLFIVFLTKYNQSKENFIKRQKRKAAGMKIIKVSKF